MVQYTQRYYVGYDTTRRYVVTYTALVVNARHAILYDNTVITTLIAGEYWQAALRQYLIILIV